MLEPQVKSVPTTCPLGMVGGEPHTIATRRQRGMSRLHESKVLYYAQGSYFFWYQQNNVYMFLSKNVAMF